MALFDFSRNDEFEQGLTEWKNTPGAVLLDVRSAEEYGRGHIPGSINLPLNEMGRVPEVIPNKETPVFTYCLSGTRSNRAAAYMGKVGYIRVKNIGGINRYKGELTK